jgi:GntR family transcriptional regulator / MocR family aminotransferase
MRPWTFPVALQAGPDSPSRNPAYQQIAQAIRGDIRRGRLRPGDALPGSRSLAQTLGVHRNTVLAAYRELEAEGWTSSGQRSTRVASDLPEAPARRPRSDHGAGYDLAPPHAPGPWASLRQGPPETLSLSGGLPDLRLVPTDLLARAFRRALKTPALLGYGDPMGEARLRAALGVLLSEMRGLAVSADQVLVTPGSQGALDLVARTLLQPGDRVAVEDPGYESAWATLRATGAELVPVPVDGAGMQVEALEACLREGPLRAIYLTPHHQYPTTVTMSAPRRLRLLELARQRRIAILEDDYDNEFHFEGRPVLPLAGDDPGGVVLYLGTLSKILAPGLRIGFVTGPRTVVEVLAARRAIADGQGNLTLQRAAAELLEEGLLQRHARKMRRTYLARRGALADALGWHLGGSVSFELPPGGMSLWLKLDPSLDAEAWAERALRLGVRVDPGRRFDFRGQPLPNLRLGYSALDERELDEAVRRLARAL